MISLGKQVARNNAIKMNEAKVALIQTFTLGKRFPSADDRSRKATSAF